MGATWKCMELGQSVYHSRVSSKRPVRGAAECGAARAATGHGAHRWAARQSRPPRSPLPAAPFCRPAAWEPPRPRPPCAGKRNSSHRHEDKHTLSTKTSTRCRHTLGYVVGSTNNPVSQSVSYFTGPIPSNLVVCIMQGVCGVCAFAFMRIVQSRTEPGISSVAHGGSVV